MIINIDTVFPKKSALFGITTDYSHSKVRFTDVLNHFTHCESPPASEVVQVLEYTNHAPVE